MLPSRLTCRLICRWTGCAYCREEIQWVVKEVTMVIIVMVVAPVAAAATALHSILYHLSISLSFSFSLLTIDISHRFTTLSSLSTYLRPPYPNLFTRSRQSASSLRYFALCFFTYVCDRIMACTGIGKKDKKGKSRSILWSFLYQYDFDSSRIKFVYEISLRFRNI